MSEELKLCRQCGGPGIVNIHRGGGGIQCMDCTYEEADSTEWDADRPITKADVDEHCKANGLVLVPEETINKMEDLYGILDGTHKRLKHETDDILGGIMDDIAAFKEQAL